MWAHGGSSQSIDTEAARRSWQAARGVPDAGPGPPRWCGLAGPEISAFVSDLAAAGRLAAERRARHAHPRAIAPPPVHGRRRFRREERVTTPEPH